MMQEIEKKKAILKRRAEQLAKPLEKTDYSEDMVEILLFKLANEQYGIETIYIKEVFPFKDYTPLPTTPSFLYGLFNLRRRILSIIDLRVFFSLHSDPKSDYKVIILENAEKEFGILCEEINGIQNIPVKHIQPSLPTLTGIREDFLRGVTNDRAVILDGQKLLNSKQLIVDETVE